MLTWRSFKLYNMFDPAYWADGAPVMVTFLVLAHICHATDVDFPWTHAWCFGCYGSESSGRCWRSLESVMLWNWLRLEDVMMLLPDCWCRAIVIELAHIFHALELVVLGGCWRDVPWSCTHVWSGLSWHYIIQIVASQWSIFRYRGPIISESWNSSVV